MNTSPTPADDKKPIAINCVFMHKHAHADEYVLLCILRKYGETAFPGISKAVVRFLDSDVAGSDADFDGLGILPIGCCGTRFDEHRGKNGQKERLQGECATTLGTKYVGIMDRPELKELILDVLYFDTNAKCRPTQLPELIKVMHRYNLKNDEYAVLSWATTAIDAIIEQERFHFASLSNEKTLVELFQAEIDKGYFTEDRRSQSVLRNRINDSVMRKDDSPWQLAHILECLFRKPLAAKDIENWLDAAMTAMNADQVDFWQQVDQLKKRASIEVPVLLWNKEKLLKLMVCTGENKNLQKAARHLGNDIILVRQQSGNTQLFIDTDINGLNLANVARMIRFLELSPEQKAEANWQQLGCEGKYPGVDQWHYFKKGEMLFNGNDTHAARASGLATQALVEVLQNAFHPKYVKQWCTMRGIQMNPFPLTRKTESVKVTQVA